jgi:hypothetical protein
VVVAFAVLDRDVVIVGVFYGGRDYEAVLGRTRPGSPVGTLTSVLEDWLWDRALSRRSCLGVVGATASAATLAACGSAPKSASTITVTVPASAVITTETPRPQITNPDAALDRLLAGNRRFVEGQMRHPDQDRNRRLRIHRSKTRTR